MMEVLAYSLTVACKYAMVLSGFSSSKAKQSWRKKDGTSRSACPSPRVKVTAESNSIFFSGTVEKPIHCRTHLTLSIDAGLRCERMFDTIL